MPTTHSQGFSIREARRKKALRKKKRLSKDAGNTEESNAKKSKRNDNLYTPRSTTIPKYKRQSTAKTSSSKRHLTFDISAEKNTQKNNRSFNKNRSAKPTKNPIKREDNSTSPKSTSTPNDEVDSTLGFDLLDDLVTQSHDNLQKHLDLKNVTYPLDEFKLVKTISFKKPFTFRKKLSTNL